MNVVENMVRSDVRNMDVLLKAVEHRHVILFTTLLFSLLRVASTFYITNHSKIVNY